MAEPTRKLQALSRAGLLIPGWSLFVHRAASIFMATPLFVRTRPKVMKLVPTRRTEQFP
jgi:hypothetical protein